MYESRKGILDALEVGTQSRPNALVSQNRLGQFNCNMTMECNLTSVSGLSGGPDAISADFVPGRILLSAPCSSLVMSSASMVDAASVVFMLGEFGVI